MRIHKAGQAAITDSKGLKRMVPASEVLLNRADQDLYAGFGDYCDRLRAVYLAGDSDENFEATFKQSEAPADYWAPIGEQAGISEIGVETRTGIVNSAGAYLEVASPARLLLDPLRGAFDALRLRLQVFPVSGHLGSFSSFSYHSGNSRLTTSERITLLDLTASHLFSLAIRRDEHFKGLELEALSPGNRGTDTLELYFAPLELAPRILDSVGRVFSQTKGTPLDQAVGERELLARSLNPQARATAIQRYQHAVTSTLQAAGLSS